MSFGGRAYGSYLDYEGLLPRRVRRVLALALIALIALRPDVYVSLTTEYARQQGADMWERIEPHVDLPTSTTTVP